MTAREKAQAGLWMIQQAVRQLISDKGPVQPYEVCDELGLRYQTDKGEQSIGIAYEVMQGMTADAGPLVKDGARSTYSLRPGSTQS